MTDDQRVIGLLVRYATDTASAKQSEEAAKSIALRFNSVADAAKKLNLSAEQVRALNDATEKLAASSQSVRPATGLLAQGDATASIGFMRDLEAIQARENELALQQLGTEKQITSELEKQATAAGKASIAGGTAQARTLGESVTKAGRELFMLPDVGPSTDISRGLILGGAVIDKFNVSTAQLAAGIPIAGAALVGLLVVADLIGDAAEESADRQRRYGNALLEAAEAAETSTKKQIAAQISELELRNRVLQRANEGILELTHVSGEFLSSLSRTEVVDFSLAGMVTNLQAANLGITENAEQYKNNNRELDANNFLMGALRDILNESGAAAGEAIAAEQQLADARQEAADRINEVERNNANTVLRAQQMTAQERQKEAASIQANIGALEAYIANGNLSSETVKALNAQIIDLENEYVILTETTWTYADSIADLERVTAANEELQRQWAASQVDAVNRLVAADGLTLAQREQQIAQAESERAIIREQLTNTNLSHEARTQLMIQERELTDQIETLSDVTDTYADGLERERVLKDLLKETGKQLTDAYKLEGKARDDLIKLQQELTEAEQEHADELSRIDTERISKIRDAEDKRIGDEAKAREESAKDLAKALEKIQKDSDERIEQIRINSSRNILRMIARGDQAAAIEALEDQAFAIEQEKKKRKDAEEEKVQEIDDRLKDQLEVIEDRYEEQVKAANKAAREATDAQNARWRKEKADRDQAIREAENALRNAQAATLAIEEQYRRNSRQLQELHNNAQLGIFSGGLSDIRGAIITWINNVLGDIRATPKPQPTPTPPPPPTGGSQFPPLVDGDGNIIGGGGPGVPGFGIFGVSPSAPDFFPRRAPAVSIPETDSSLAAAMGSSHYEINLVQREGESNQDLAERMIRELDKRDQAMNRSIGKMARTYGRERQRRFSRQ